MAARTGWVSRYVVHPLLWILVRFCDWTDGFTHRGLKNGARVAASLYLVALWLYLIYVAVMLVVIVVLLCRERRLLGCSVGRFDERTHTITGAPSLKVKC